VPLPHNFHSHISDKERLWVMYQMCYTAPKNCSVSYNVENLVLTVFFFIFFCPRWDSNPTPLKFWRGQERVVPRNLSGPRDPPLVIGQSAVLPDWIMSGLSRIAGGCGMDVVSGMQCSLKVQGTLPLENLEVFHVRHTFCVKCLVEDGTLQMHKRNATHVAYYGDILFMACIPETHKISSFKAEYKLVNQYSKVISQGVIEPVKNISKCMHWLMIDRAEFEGLVGKGNLCLLCAVYFCNLSDFK